MVSRERTSTRIEEPFSSPGLAWASLNLGYQRICPHLTWQHPRPANRFYKSLLVEFKAAQTELCLASTHLRYLPELASQGLLKPLDDIISAKEMEDYFRPFLDLCCFEGKLYAIPEDFSPYVLASRREVLAAYRFSPPKTWKELERQAQQISAEQKRPVIGMGTATPHQILSFLLGLLASNGISPPRSSEEILAKRREYAQVYDWVHVLRQKQCLDSQMFGNRDYGVGDCFNRNAWTYRFCFLRDIKNESPNFFKAVHIQPLPLGPSGKHPITIGNGHGWIIPQRSLRQKEGVEALRKVTSLKISLELERRQGNPFHAHTRIWKDRKILNSNFLYHLASSLMSEKSLCKADEASDFLNWLGRSFATALRRNHSSKKWLAKIPRTVQRDTHNIVQQAVSQIEKNYMHDISIEDISKKLDTSRRHLDRLFLQEMNISVSDYLKNLRMEQAHDLLRKTSLTVKEVANKTGFSDQSVFSRTFHRHWGAKPREIRIHGAKARAKIVS